MERELYEIQVNITGEKETVALAAATSEAEKRLEALLEAFSRAPQLASRYKQAVADVNSQVHLLGVSGRHAMEELNQYTAQAGRGFGGLKMSMRDVGYVADDLQYVFQNGMGLRPIINNLMMFAPQLGLAAMAIDLLARNWDVLMGAFSESKTKTEADLMKELGEKTEKTADETKRLMEYEERRSTIREQQTGKTTGQKSMNADVNRAVIDSGYEGIVSGLVLTKLQTDPRFAKKGLNTEERNRIYEDVKQKSEQQVQDATANSANSPKALKSLIETILNNKDVFGGEKKANQTLQKLMAATPEYKEAQDENEKVARRAAEASATRKTLKSIDDDKLAKQRAIDEEKEREKRKADSEERQRRQANRETRNEAVQFNSQRFDRLGGAQALDIATQFQLKNGANPDAVMKSIVQRLEGSMGREAATGRAREVVDSARGRLANQEPPRIANSQTMDAASLASYYQGAVSNKNNPMEQLKEAQMANRNLTLIVQELRRVRRIPAVVD